MPNALAVRMILLVTSIAAGIQLKQLLHAGIGEEVELIASLSEAAVRLRRRAHSAVVIDQDLVDMEPDGELTVVQNCGTALLLYFKLSICSPERVLREVSIALRRQAAERIAAMRMVSSDLKKEFAGAVTGILLSSELAMSVPELPRAAQVKIKFVHDLAQGIRRRLEA